ncbi:hypothetical protein [Epibacterium sp. Ofav1-8]|uniref:hypothetical protein n=1 Tax=Epibacterium sp. Ofav1-8 TaxID=2917735 RepID=UPI001EF690EE|nr:hypothetical protein [Epibacterium sp. Ofav1-8]
MQRKVLQYTVECALPNGDTAFGVHDGTRYEFAGAIGIAPEWREGPLPKPKQLDLTACLLARTNAFGVSVAISLRSESGGLAALPMFAASQEEHEDFPLWEGAFFGNIFDPNPVAYACTGAGGKDAALRALKRICTLPTAQTTTDGAQVSACGFVVLGTCEDVATTPIGRVFADHMVHVYLPDRAVSP